MLTDVGRCVGDHRAVRPFPNRIWLDAPTGGVARCTIGQERLPQSALEMTPVQTVCELAVDATAEVLDRRLAFYYLRCVIHPEQPDEVTGVRHHRHAVEFSQRRVESVGLLRHFRPG